MGEERLAASSLKCALAPSRPYPVFSRASPNPKAHHYSNELGAALAAACTDGAPTRVLQLLAAGAAPGWRRAVPDASESEGSGESAGEERRTCIEQAHACGQWGCAALLEQVGLHPNPDPDPDPNPNPSPSPSPDPKP